ncbi:MAG: hypothetical protein ACKO0V_03370 [bacterium]
MAEIFDQLTDEMLQAPPPKYSRAEILEQLMLVFAPVGPSETLLVEDLATVRTKIQQADSRRDSIFVVQQLSAAKLYGIRSARESADLETLWASDPGHFHQLMKHDALFLNQSVKLWRSLVTVCEDPAAAPSPRLTAGILRANAQPGPAGELESQSRELLCLAIALQKNAQSYAQSVQSALGAELPLAEIARQLPDPAAARTQLLALARNQLDQAEASLAAAVQRQAIAQSHFSQCHHAGQDHLESLKLIVADIRQLQIRHDKTLRTLYFLQNSRTRQAERAGEQARRQAEKTIEKPHKEPEKPASPQATETTRPRQPAATNIPLDDHIINKVLSQLVNDLPQPATPASQSPEDAKAIEADLLNGSLQSPVADQIRLVFSYWTDHELFDHSHRFRTTFRRLKNSFLIDKIKEIAAEERQARHDRLKITEQHQAG